MKHLITALILCWFFTVPAAIATPQSPTPDSELLTLPPQVWEEIRKLTADDAAPGDSFGVSVSISGDTLVVGMPGDDDAGDDSGSAYVFERNQDGAEEWEQVKKLTADDAATEDYFGFSVSISGNILVVGTPGNDDAGDDSGSAYVFERNQGGVDKWGQVKKLTADDAATEDSFGFSVSISEDTVVVGSLCDSDAGACSGSVYVFERHQDGMDKWGQVRKINADDAEAGDSFGISVSINEDTVVVGSFCDSDAGACSGSAYVFERHQDEWEQARKLNADDAVAGDQFGASVSVSGDTLVVGAVRLFEGASAGSGSAYVFERNRGGADKWGQVKKISADDATAEDGFGFSVSISGDTLGVGARLKDDAGAESGSAYVFERHQGGVGQWGQVKKINADDAAAHDQFGTSVSISGDTLVVGAPGDTFTGTSAGAAHVFDDTSSSSSSCTDGPTGMCLNSERFLVEVDWRDFQGGTGSGRVVPFGSANSGLFYFFNSDNWEMLVKVLNGCPITDHYWVFAAATTNVEYTLRVTDTLTGASKSYFNALGNSASAITDTEALDSCGASVASGVSAVRLDPGASTTPFKGHTCVNSAISCNSTVSGVLTDHDCELGDGTYVDFWEFDADAGTDVTISLDSTDFDAFLQLNDPSLDLVAQDDDSGSGFNARIDHELTEAGTWTIAANNVVPPDLGDYTLSLTCSTLGSGGCTANATDLCLSDGRFRVEVEWEDFAGNRGSGQAVPGSDGSGLFWFFGSDNWEMLVKVLNGCRLNDRFWVFSAATTNVEYTLRVTDTQTGVTKSYFNRLGRSAPAITDTSAFATCP